jgi:PhoH-like ATPase
MNRPTVVVLDTNVLIDNPKAIFGFPDDLVVIPSVVIDELDNLKDSKDRNVRRMSRMASNFIDEITEKYEESEDDLMYIPNGGVMKIDELYQINFPTSQPEKPDNLIISTAIRYACSNDYYLVTMYSNDTNVRNKTRIQARAMGLKHKMKARRYAIIDSSLNDIDSGIRDLFLPDMDVIMLRKNGYHNIDLSYLNGEHIIVRSETNPDRNTALASWDARQKRIVCLPDYKKGSPIWLIGGGKEGSTPVRPRDARQAFMAHDILDETKNLHFVLSPVAGAGKNYIATACALNLLKDGLYDRLIIIKPMISVEGSDTGYLPGTKEEKMAPWFESFNDTMAELTNDGQMNISDLEARIELDIVTHMRGRSIPRTIMIIDEAQNFTEEALKTLGSRAGEGSKIILMGDLSQIDNPRLDAGNSGLRIWAERARNIENGYPNSTYVLLESNFRSELSAWFSSFYE